MNTKASKITKNIVSILFISLLFLCACNKWTYDEELYGISFKKYRYSIPENDTTGIIGYIDSDMEINGIPCAEGWVHFSAEMNLKFFCLAKPTALENVSLPKNTWVVSDYSYENLTVIFPNDTLINPHYSPLFI